MRFRQDPVAGVCVCVGRVLRTAMMMMMMMMLVIHDSVVWCGVCVYVLTSRIFPVSLPSTSFCPNLSALYTPTVDAVDSRGHRSICHDVLFVVVGDVEVFDGCGF